MNKLIILNAFLAAANIIVIAVRVWSRPKANSNIKNPSK